MPAALYRRYRPQSFSEVIGQEHVTVPLMQALKADRVHHAYLFSGPRGCGKTTSARILARCLNCEQGPTDTPCGQCASCVALAREGSGSVDVVEIDAASHGGVDDARDLRERAVFAPASSRFKIYIIDEAHMVSSAGFNALLKLVEEPPEHVKFIFATTEPDKVIGTIRSRTHHYPFRLVPTGVLQAYLEQVCQREGVHVETGVLPLVVRAGAGSVRDSLSVLDQLLAGAPASGLDVAAASALLGYTDAALLDEVIDAFAAGDGAASFAVVDKVVEGGADPRRFAEDVLTRLRDLIVLQAVGEQEQALAQGLLGEIPADQQQRMREQAARFGAASLTRAAQVFNEGLVQMRGVTAPRLHVELLCARVVLPTVDASELGVLARLEQVEAAQRHGGSSPPSPREQVRAQAAQVSSAPSVAADPPPHPQPSAAVDPSAAPEPTSQAEASPASSSGPTGRVVEDAAPISSPAGRAGAAALSVRAVMAAATGATPEAGLEAAHEPGEPSQQQQPPVPPQVAGQPEASTATHPSGVNVAAVRHSWPQVLEQLKTLRRFTWSLVSQNAGVHSVQGHTLTLAFINAGARDRFLTGDNAAHVRQALQLVVSGGWQVEALVDPSAVGAGSFSPPLAASPASSLPEPDDQPSPLSEGAAPAAQSAEPSLDDENLDPESTLDLLRRGLGAEVIDEMNARG